jgi:hypothetical protein
MVLAACALTVTATAMATGVAGAAATVPQESVAQPLTSHLAAVEALGPDNPSSVVVAPASAGDLPAKPLRRVRSDQRARPGSAAPARARVHGKQTTRTRSVARRPAAPRPSGSLAVAVSRIPGYSAHRPAHWVLTSRYGHWGATDLGANTIYISPSVPASKLDSVVRHEWSHILTIRAYGGVRAALAGTNRAFGGSGMLGAERAADCMARELGATWTSYTSCTSGAWRAAAARILAGRPA